MKIKKSTRNKIISRAAKILKEEMAAGIDMLNWNELRVGDLIDVIGEFENYKKVRITKKLPDVSKESGLPPGPGFIGYPSGSPFGEKESFVFSVGDIDVASYQKYALAEAKKMRTVAMLKALVREHTKN